MRMAERMTGVPAPRLVASPGVLRAMAAVMDVVGRLVPLPESYTGEGLRVIAGVTYLGDNSKARRDLGYAPRPLEQGLRETLLHEMKLLGMTAPAT
jgi:dihydroflavonol-4-reductase